MLYELNGDIYIKQGDKYFLADVLPKPTTIVVMPTNEYKDVLEGAKEITFQELKARYVK
jgi:hypothetical protein